MRVLVTGDREWTDRETIRHELVKFDPMTTTLIVGGARGADQIAYDVARELEFFCIETYPAWWKQGKSAGPIRNRRMLRTVPDIVLAFHADLAHSKGTKDMVEIARLEGVEVKHFMGREANAGDVG
jgi:hypothetical protein